MKRTVNKHSIRLLSVLAIVVLLGIAACAPAPVPTPAPVPSPTPPTPSPAPSPAPTPTTTPTPKPSPSPTPTSAALTAKTMSKGGIGDYLVDARGMTLYYFTRDVIGKSNASEAVVANWHLFNPASFVVPPNLNAADFGTITREDGKKQATYKGWPLYYFARDLGPGDTQGEGVNAAWYVIKVPFYTTMIQTKANIGNYLVDAKGMTLYYFTRDAVGKSNAGAAVIDNWPIFNPDSFVIPIALKGEDFGTITRDDGKKQATFK